MPKAKNTRSLFFSLIKGCARAIRWQTLHHHTCANTCSQSGQPCRSARTHARTHRRALRASLAYLHTMLTLQTQVPFVSNNVPCSFWVHMIHMHNIHIHPYTHTYIHSYIRTYIHTYIHTYIEVGYKCHSLRPMLQIPYTTLQSFAWGVSR